MTYNVFGWTLNLAQSITAYYSLTSMQFIGVGRGALSARAPPPGRRKKIEKKIKRNLQWKVVRAPQAGKCTPRQSKKSNFIAHFWWAVKIWSVGAVNLVFLACVLRAATKKVVLFRGKSAPQIKSWIRL